MVSMLRRPAERPRLVSLIWRPSLITFRTSLYKDHNKTHHPKTSRNTPGEFLFQFHYVGLLRRQPVAVGEAFRSPAVDAVRNRARISLTVSRTVMLMSVVYSDHARGRGTEYPSDRGLHFAFCQLPCYHRITFEWRNLLRRGDTPCRAQLRRSYSYYS